MDPAQKLARARKALTDGPISALPQVKALACGLGKSCAACRGSGLAIVARGAHAHADLCKCVTQCPACFGQARIAVEGNASRSCRTPSPVLVANLVNAAHIPARYAEASLEKFQNFSGNAKDFLKDLERWKTDFRPIKGQGLVITGPVGVGKTYVLAALAKSMAEAGHSVRFTDFFQLLGELKAGFSEGKADHQQLQPLIDVDVLLIDELGKGRANDFELTVLDQLISGRYNQSKTIIASTNYQVGSKRYYLDQELTRGQFDPRNFGPLEERIGGRIYSRLTEMCRFATLSGDDFRLKERY